MALTVASSMTLYSEHETDDLDEGTASAYVEGFRSGAAYVGFEIDIETLHTYNIVTVPPVNMSTDHIGVWIEIANPADADTKANGGIRICAKDSTGRESYWFVGGSDTYKGGWNFFVAYCGDAPDANLAGTALVSDNADMTDVANIGIGGKMIVKAAPVDNFHLDAMYYGDPTLIITGTPTVAGEGMQEAFDLTDSAALGLLDKQSGSFIGKGTIQFNDNGTGACGFTDYGSTFRFADFPVSSTAFKFSLGSSTGITTVDFGTVVGTGDGRQGVSGMNIGALGQSFALDFATNLSANAGNRVKLYGCNVKGASQGVAFDDNAKTTIISNFTNCDGLDQGATGGGAEILNTFIIDPTGVTNNYGLTFPQTPSAGTLTHNCKNISFITSGSPATQYMLNFPEGSDYGITFSDFIVYGDYSSATLWHGINTGLNADVTITPSGGTNLVQAEFSSTNTGTVTVAAVAVSLVISAAVSLVGAEVTIYDANGAAGSYGDELAHSETYGSATYTYAGVASNLIRVQIMLPGYEEFTQETTMPTANGTFFANLEVETN